MSKISLPDGGNGFCPQTLFLYGTYKEDGTPNFGLFCWFSYYWNDGLGAMVCIGEDKLTQRRIKATGIFSANLVTESILPLADYFGNTPGNDPAKMQVPVSVEKGAVLDVPILADSPRGFELEVEKTVEMAAHSAVYLCRVRNVFSDESLTREGINPEEHLRTIKPVSTTCQTYFSWDGKSLGKWGEPQKRLQRG